MTESAPELDVEKDAKNATAHWRARSSRVLHLLTPALLGAAVFFVVTGGRALWPRNIAWLSKGDPATYFLSWHFFRNTPWSLPLGSNPRYGAELGSSIAFADNVPLFAFPFKAIHHWLPNPFQYFGFWLLCCFVLQAYFAWLLVGLLTQRRVLRAVATALFLFAPPFLWRLQGHYSLASHGLVLAALYLCLGPRRLARGPAWPVLAFVVSLVHPYTTAMVLALWFADWLSRVLFEGWSRADGLQLIAVPALVLLGVWQAGLFVGSGLRKEGFGDYRMNLASLIDPSGWSYLLPDLPEGESDYEGFNFLGLGGLLLLLFALPALKGAWRGLGARRRYWPLAACLLALALFAITNRIGIAGHTFEIPLPPAVIDRANLLRASGRMFWPAYYALSWVLLRTLFRRYSPRFAGGVLFVALMIQALDTSAGWLPIRRELMVFGTSWISPLNARFWAKVPAQYQVIRMIPPRNLGPGYEVFAYFAATHGMESDAVYLARVDQEQLARARWRAMQAVYYGKYAAGTLYIVDPRFEQPARRSLNPKLDLLTWVDGFLVLAPGWKCRPECVAASRPSEDCSPRCPHQ